MLFKEIIAVYTEKHTKRINTKQKVADFKAAGTYSYHSDLNG
jgi:hypothetical protein